MRENYRTFHAPTNFGTVAYHVKGNLLSSKLLVYLHGHFDSGMESKANSIYLFEHNTNILNVMLDHRWHGSSTKTKYYPSLSERAEDINIVIRDILTTFPRVEDIYLIGYSQGGSVLLYYILNDDVHMKIRHAFLLAPRLNLSRYLEWYESELNSKDYTERGEFLKKYKSKGMVLFNQSFIKDFAQVNFFKSIHKLKTQATLFIPELDTISTEEDIQNLILTKNDLLNVVVLPNHAHTLTPEQWQELGVRIEENIASF